MITAKRVKRVTSGIYLTDFAMRDDSFHEDTESEIMHDAPRLPDSSDPALLPALNNPALLPAPSDPARLPATTDPARLPAPSDPAKLPAPSDPGRLPAPSDPAPLPAPSDPARLPAPSDPPQLPAPSDPPQLSAPSDPPQLTAPSDTCRMPAPSDPPQLSGCNTPTPLAHLAGRIVIAMEEAAKKRLAAKQEADRKLLADMEAAMKVLAEEEAAKEHLNSPPTDNDPDSDDEDEPLCNFTTCYENEFGVRFRQGDVCVLGKSSATFDLIRILEVFPKEKKVQALYLRIRNDRNVAPYTRQYKESFTEKFEKLLYTLSNRRQLPKEEETTIKGILKGVFS